MNKISILAGIVVVAGGMYAARVLDKQEPTDIVGQNRQSNEKEMLIEDAGSSPSDTLAENQLKIGTEVITIEVADSPEERMQGLSGRDQLEQNSGMLFVFDSPTKPSFWMKDMHFPIDIVWIDEDGAIVDFQQNISPTTFPQTFSPTVHIVYALEMEAGWIRAHEIAIGEKVTGSMIK